MTTDRDDGALDALLRSARGADAPGDDLVARVLADADRVQAGFAAAAPARAAVPRGGWLAGVIASVGGWPAVSGVTLAGLTGLAVGFAAPDLVDGWSGGQIWTLTGGGETMPEIGALWDGTLNDTWDNMGGMGDV